MPCIDCKDTGRVPGGHGDYDACSSCDTYARVQKTLFAVVKKLAVAPTGNPETGYDAFEDGPLDDL